MGDNESRGVSVSEAKVSEGQYELDMEKHSATDLDAAIKEAVEAVDQEPASGAHEALGDDAQMPEPGDSSELAPAEASGDRDQAMVAGLKERLLRTLADFDNYRKRAEREKESLRKMGTFEVLKDFVGVIDNLERAVDSSGNIDDLKQGLRLILRQQEEFLRRHGVEKIDTVGQAFDPAIHEAVARQESNEVTEPTVTGELQTGYLLYERLLRPAMVHVAMPSAPRDEGRERRTTAAGNGSEADGDERRAAGPGEIEEEVGGAAD